MIFSQIKKNIPGKYLLFYHKLLAIFANLIYRFPSRQLVVVGVTGTNGKTSTCNLIWQILTEAGYKVGLTSSINFKISERSWVNRTKQGMQGRFKLQKILRQMVKAGCQYAVIETTSEGIVQYRHWGIFYNIAVVTNLTPEHIESHGSFENYKKAKAELFRALALSSQDKTVSLVNLDDEYADYFLGFEAQEKWGYQIKSQISNPKSQPPNFKNLPVINYQLSAKGAEFKVQLDDKVYDFKTNLLGEFNIYNCLAAICVGLSQDIDIKIIKKALEKVSGISGRMERVDSGRDFTVIVDYAHDPVALDKIYQTIYKIKSKVKSQKLNPQLKSQKLATGDFGSKLIAVLGAVGGGRDTAKRPKLGRLASQYADYVIITNEDPYDDDPMKIIRQVEAGVKDEGSKILNKNYWVIEDRRQAIKKALSLAQAGDIVVISGKGAEETMAVKHGYVPWDDRKVVRELLDLKQKS